jgi:hypothetical protein
VLLLGSYHTDVFLHADIGVRRYWRIFLNIRASHGRTQILLSANIYVFLNIRVSHGRILGGSTQIFELTFLFFLL